MNDRLAARSGKLNDGPGWCFLISPIIQWMDNDFAGAVAGNVGTKNR